LSVENFGTNPVYGFTAAYHISEDFFFQGAFGRSQAGRTSFETLSNINLLTPLRGTSRTNDSRSATTSFLARCSWSQDRHDELLLSAGRIGSTDFAGDSKFTVNFGGGYRVLPTDWIAVHIDVEDHVFQSDLLGVDKLTNNLEATIGASVFF